jgi:hypothetical protein
MKATSWGKLARASLSMPMGWVARRKDKIPAGPTIHKSRAAATPHINPAPGLVARLEKKTPKAAPKSPPYKTPFINDVARRTL